MKTALLLFAVGSICISNQAQVGTSPRTLTKRIEPLVRPQPPRAPATPPPAMNPNAAAPATARPPSEKDKEQKQMELAAEEKRKLQWQMDRAEKGSDNAQYQIGMRYVKGEGLEKDLVKAKKWLEASAKQGNADAKKELAKLEGKK